MKGYIFAATLALVPAAALADPTVTLSLPVQVNQKLAIVATPPTPTVTCDANAGDVVATITMTGGNGKPVTLSSADMPADFVLSATSPPANVVVGPNGITEGCAAAPFVNNMSITATQ